MLVLLLPALNSDLNQVRQGWPSLDPLVQLRSGQYFIKLGCDLITEFLLHLKRYLLLEVIGCHHSQLLLIIICLIVIRLGLHFEFFNFLQLVRYHDIFVPNMILVHRYPPVLAGKLFPEFSHLLD